MLTALCNVLCGFVCACVLCVRVCVASCNAAATADMSEKKIEPNASTYVILARKHLRFNQPNKVAVPFHNELHAAYTFRDRQTDRHKLTQTQTQTHTRTLEVTHGRHAG